MSKKIKKFIVALIVILCLSLSTSIIFAQADAGITLTVSDSNPQNVAINSPYVFPDVTTAEYFSGEGTPKDLSDKVTVYVEHMESVWTAVTEETLISETARTYTPSGHGYYRMVYKLQHNGEEKVAYHNFCVADTLVSISADVTNVKTTYNVGEDLNLSGLVINLTKSYSGLVGALNSSDYFVDSSDFNNNEAGEYDIVVSYTQEYANATITKTDKFTVTVLASGQTTDPELSIAGVYAKVDESSKVSKAAYGMSYAFLNPVATYKDEHGDAVDVTSFVKVQVYHGVATGYFVFDWTPVTEQLDYSESKSFIPQDHGYFQVLYTVAYAGLTVTAEDIIEIQDTLVSIEVDTSNVFTTLNIDEDLDLTKLIVKKSMSYTTIVAGSAPVVLDATAYSVDTSAFKKGVQGEYEIVVSYTETYGGTKTATFTVTVVSADIPIDREILILMLNTENQAENIAYGLPFAYPTATATYTAPDGKTTSDVSSSIAISVEYGTADLSGVIWTPVYDDVLDLENGTFTPNNHGYFRIVYTITQGNKTKTAYLQTNIQDTLVSISVDVSAVKTVLEVGDTLDLTGLIVTKNMSYSGASQLANDAFTIDNSAFKDNTVGTYEIVVSYAETYGGTQTATFTVELKDKLQSVAFNSNPSKTEYAYGESFDFTGVSVTATYALQGAVTIDVSDLAVSGFNANTIGSQQVKIVYGAYESDLFSVTVLDELYMILLTTQNVKVEYNVGDEIDLTNLKVEKVMRSETKTEISLSDCSIDYEGYSKESPEGTYTVTVSYTENGVTKTAGFDITVTNAQGGNENNTADKGGCGSYIGANSIIIATLLIVAVASICIIRKKA